MRVAILLIVLTVPVCAQAPYTWNALPNSPTAGYRFDDLEAVSPHVLYIVGGSDPYGIYRTLDGGETWEARFSETQGRYFRSLGFVSETRGWVGVLGSGPGEDVLFETTDGGTTLTPATGRITGPTPLAICGIYALDDEAVYATGGISGGAHFLSTLDAGETWTSIDLSTQADFLIDVFFLDRRRGFVVGGAGFVPGVSPRVAVVLGTEDGGQTWTERHRSTTVEPFGEWGWKLSFPSPEVGYVSVENGSKVLKTTDGGATWHDVLIPSFSMQGIGFVNEQTGWVGGRDIPEVTTDGGQTWALAPGLGQSVNRFAFFGDSLGYAVAERVYRYSQTPPVAADPTPAEPSVWTGDPYPNPFPDRALFPFTLPMPAEVSLEVFDATGRQVAFVDYGLRPGGSDELLWNARSRAGLALPAGTYMYRLRTGDTVSTGTVTKALAGR